MLNLRKETECGIQLLKFLSKNQKEVSSLKDISEKIGISFLFLQKIARKLKIAGFIGARQGMMGGYVLLKDPKKLSLKDIVGVLEDKCLLLSCLDKNCKKLCSKIKGCKTRVKLGKLNKQIEKMMEDIKLKDL